MAPARAPSKASRCLAVAISPDGDGGRIGRRMAWVAADHGPRGPTSPSASSPPGHHRSTPDRSTWLCHGPAPLTTVSTHRLSWHPARRPAPRPDECPPRRSTPSGQPQRPRSRASRFLEPLEGYRTHARGHRVRAGSAALLLARRWSQPMRGGRRASTGAPDRPAENTRHRRPRSGRGPTGGSGLVRTGVQESVRRRIARVPAAARQTPLPHRSGVRCHGISRASLGPRPSRHPPERGPELKESSGEHR